MRVPFPQYLALFSLGFSSCYAHQGDQYDADPIQLIENAEDACLRNDPVSSKTFLTRLVNVFPESHFVFFASQSLGANSTCVALQSLRSAHPFIEKKIQKKTD